MLRTAIALILMAACLPWLSSCWTECCPNEPEDDGRSIVVRPPPTREPAPNGPAPLPYARYCAPTGSMDSSYVCYETDSTTYLANCQGSQCAKLAVTVQYLLDQDLGTGHTAIIEAFDNPWFKGSPAALLRLTNFDASRPGKSASDHLLLAPGEYYLRAYLAPDMGPPAPYDYQGMKVVGNRPFGLYGALSDATRIVLAPGGDGQDVVIPLDKLFKSPEADEPTRARVRVILKIDPSYPVPLGQKVLVQLHRRSDFSYLPLYEFSLPSEALTVATRPGSAELITDELEPGQLYVLAFLDHSGNGYLDDGEPRQVHREAGRLAAVPVDRDRTVTIELLLTPDADLEE